MGLVNEVTAWVCADCRLVSAGYSLVELGYDLDAGEVPDAMPLGLVAAGTVITDGMVAADHECESRWIGHRPVLHCGEEGRTFDDSACEGCGSGLAGARHAVTFSTFD